MNKNLLGIFCLAASVAASAQSIPSTYNYQGICDKASTDVTVVFNVLANGEVVYSEAQTVRTNSDCAFTALVGNGNATVGAWDEIEWTNGEYSLQTSVDGTVVSNCLMVAVPYATVAERVLGMENIQDIADEAAAANMKAEAYYQSVMAQMEEVFTNIDQQFNNIDENASMTNEMLEQMLADIEANKEAIEQAGKNSITYYDSVKAEMEEVFGAIQQNFDNIDENSTMANEIIDKLLTDVDDINEGLQGMDARYGELFEKYAEAIEALQANFDNIDENAVMTAELIENMLAEIEDNKDAAEAANTKAEAYYQSVKAEMEEVFTEIDDQINALQAKAAAADQDYNQKIEELGGNVQLALDDIYKALENLDMMIPVLQDMEATIEKLDARVAALEKK